MSTLGCILILTVLSTATSAQHLEAKLIDPHGKESALLGYKVSASGNVLAAIGEGLQAITLFQNSGDTWGKSTHIVAKLTASDGAPLYSVSIGDSGKVVVAGAPTDTVGQNLNQGAAYIFVEPADGWKDATETAKLTSSDGSANNWFGWSVSVNGDELVVGADGAGSVQQGEAYVFTEPKGGWVSGTETAILTASNGQNGDGFGGSVVIYGFKAAVGAPGGNIGNNEGRVYVFQETLGGWVDMTQTAELTNGGGVDEMLGGMLGEIAGTVITNGCDDNGKLNQACGVRVFIEPATGWVNTDTPNAFLTAKPPPPFDQNPSIRALAMTASMIVIADELVPNTRCYHNRGNGAAFGFVKPTGGWKNVNGGIEMLPSCTPGVRGTQAGQSVAVEGNTVFLGAPYDNVGQNTDQGAVFVFSVK